MSLGDDQVKAVSLAALSPCQPIILSPLGGLAFEVINYHAGL
jgi:hypothetical protein